MEALSFRQITPAVPFLWLVRVSKCLVSGYASRAFLRTAMCEMFLNRYLRYFSPQIISTITSALSVFYK